MTMFAINIIDFKHGDAYLYEFKKKTAKARSFTLTTVKEQHHARKFNTRNDAERFARSVEMYFINNDFDLEVVEVGA